MMKDEQNAILDDLLSRWHSWARDFRLSGQAGADPMFRNARSSRGWDSVDDILDGELQNGTMKAIDFQVSEMKDPHRAAIYMNARNCYTGRNVWLSPRLPADKMARDKVIEEARTQLLGRLVRAGVI
jgi:hypothetical protein